MANRTWHMAFGFIVYLVFVILFVAYMPIATIYQYIPWILIGFGFSMFGAELPDYDQLADRLFSHRDIVTHSSLIPLAMFIIVRLISPLPPYVTFAPVLFFMFLGHASHMFLDLFPVWAGAGKMLKGQKAYGGLQAPALWLVEGVTGQEIYKKLAGTYLIHLPFKIPEAEQGKKRRKEAKLKLRKTIEKTPTRLWLTLNGIVDVVLAMLVLNAFVPFLPFLP